MHVWRGRQWRELPLNAPTVASSSCLHVTEAAVWGPLHCKGLFITEDNKQTKQKRTRTLHEHAARQAPAWFARDRGQGRR